MSTKKKSLRSPEQRQRIRYEQNHEDWDTAQCPDFWIIENSDGLLLYSEYVEGELEYGWCSSGEQNRVENAALLTRDKAMRFMAGKFLPFIDTIGCRVWRLSTVHRVSSDTSFGPEARSAARKRVLDAISREDLELAGVLDLLQEGN